MRAEPLEASPAGLNSRRLPVTSSHVLQLGLVWAPAAVFYALLLRFGTAVPIIDDFWQILSYALAWKAAPTAAAKWALLFHTQVGAYKPMFEEAVVSLQLMGGGRLHFAAMVLVSNLTMLGVFALLWRNVPAKGTSVLRMLPIGLLLFNLNYAENLDWAGCALAQLTVLLFVFAAIHFLVKREGGVGAFALACVSTLLAGFCFTNGLVLWPVGLVYLLLQFRTASWSAARTVVWTICAAVSVGIFAHGNKGTGISAHVPLWKQAVFLVSFVGGGLENMHHRPVPYLSVALGLGILATLAHAVWTRFDRRNPFFFWAMIWMLATGCGVANSRVPLGLQMALSSRYKIYCDLLLIVCYVYGLDRWQTRAQQGPALSSQHTSRLPLYLRVCTAAALLFWLGATVSGSKFLLTRKTRAEDAMRAYLRDPAHASPQFLVEDVLSPAEMEVEETSRQTMNQARQEGLYAPPPADRLGLL